MNSLKDFVVLHIKLLENIGGSEMRGYSISQHDPMANTSYKIKYIFNTVFNHS